MYTFSLFIVCLPRCTCLRKRFQWQTDWLIHKCCLRAILDQKNEKRLRAILDLANEKAYVQPRITCSIGSAKKFYVQYWITCTIYLFTCLFIIRTQFDPILSWSNEPDTARDILRLMLFRLRCRWKYVEVRVCGSTRKMQPQAKMQQHVVATVRGSMVVLYNAVYMFFCLF